MKWIIIIALLLFFFASGFIIGIAIAMDLKKKGGVSDESPGSDRQV